jgi:hypothetical protein
MVDSYCISLGGIWNCAKGDSSSQPIHQPILMRQNVVKQRSLNFGYIITIIELERVTLAKSWRKQLFNYWQKNIKGC